MKILPFLSFILLAALLLASGCTGPSHAMPGTGNGTVFPSGTSTGTSADACTFENLIGNTEVHLSMGDSCYFRTHTPIEFLNDLRMHPNTPVMVMDVPEGWITRDDAELLMQEIDSCEPAAPVVSPISSYWPFNQTSTVGNEALFLLEGYRTGKYPPALCSLNYFKPNTTEMRLWWNTTGRG
jgi:hypothetical protein